MPFLETRTEHNFCSSKVLCVFVQNALNQVSLKATWHPLPVVSLVTEDWAGGWLSSFTSLCVSACPPPCPSLTPLLSLLSIWKHVWRSSCISCRPSPSTLWSQRTALLSGVWSAAAVRSSWPSSSEWVGRSRLRTARCGCRWPSPEGHTQVARLCCREGWCFTSRKVFYIWTKVVRMLQRQTQIFQLWAELWAIVLPAQKTWGLLPFPVAPCPPRCLLSHPVQMGKKREELLMISQVLSIDLQYIFTTIDFIYCIVNVSRDL